MENILYNGYITEFQNISLVGGNSYFWQSKTGCFPFFQIFALR